MSPSIITRMSTAYASILTNEIVEKVEVRQDPGLIRVTEPLAATRINWARY